MRGAAGVDAACPGSVRGLEWLSAARDVRRRTCAVSAPPTIVEDPCERSPPHYLKVNLFGIVCRWFYCFLLYRNIFFSVAFALRSFWCLITLRKFSFKISIELILLSRKVFLKKICSCIRHIIKNIIVSLTKWIIIVISFNTQSTYLRYFEDRMKDTRHLTSKSSFNSDSCPVNVPLLSPKRNGVTPSFPLDFLERD